MRTRRVSIHLRFANSSPRRASQKRLVRLFRGIHLNFRQILHERTFLWIFAYRQLPSAKRPKRRNRSGIIPAILHHHPVHRDTIPITITTTQQICQLLVINLQIRARHFVRHVFIIARGIFRKLEYPSQRSRDQSNVVTLIIFRVILSLVFDRISKPLHGVRLPRPCLPVRNHAPVKTFQKFLHHRFANG